jgi:hypothetical protein
MLVSDERYHGYDIFIEAPARRDNTRLRADISLRNGTSVVVEFKVLADSLEALQEAADQAANYAEIFGANKCFVINFTNRDPLFWAEKLTLRALSTSNSDVDVRGQRWTRHPPSPT